MYDITAERKSIYADFEALRLYGMDIISEQRGRKVYYHVGARNFELAERKLLVDAVQSSRFFTEKKSRELIQKLEEFTSKRWCTKFILRPLGLNSLSTLRIPET
ncbi:MAG: hypothetical protein IJ801_03210 [Lachnospiraceae bacterium]|nr:hypothetical protein [Lachnospiraceae bacterium]